MSRRTTRRRFLKQAGAVGVGVWVGAAPAWTAPKSANEKLNIAFVGAGGKASDNIRGLAGLKENIVALCDVCDATAAGNFKQYDQARKFKDYRKMFDAMGKEIDAVVVTTPDHTHAHASILAMRLGKHVYCEKPLTHDVWEARQMRLEAAKAKVATQMGNQGTANSRLRRCVELVQAGEIGAVREVHLWTNRPVWPQGIDRPKSTQPVPATLDWDLWLGTAPFRPFYHGDNPKGRGVYHPFNWRGWWDFGTGALGDMACHTANMANMALKLGAPISVEAQASPFNNETYPTWAKVTYEFPSRDQMPPVKLTWYEGRKDGVLVLPPASLFQGEKVSASGCLLVGEKGTIYQRDDYGGGNIVMRGEARTEITGEPTRLERSPGHYAEFVRACKGGLPAMSNFDYAGPFTEWVLLGNVAIRAGKKLQWDAEAMQFTNAPDANKYLKREYRKGWEL